MTLTDRIAKVLRGMPSPIAAEECEPRFWRSCATWEQIIAKVAPLIADATHLRIDTVAELDALSEDSVINDAYGCTGKKLGNVWLWINDTAAWEPDLPAILLWQPEAS